MCYKKKRVTYLRFLIVQHRETKSNNSVEKTGCITCFPYFFYKRYNRNHPAAPSIHKSGFGLKSARKTGFRSVSYRAAVHKDRAGRIRVICEPGMAY